MSAEWWREREAFQESFPRTRTRQERESPYGTRKSPFDDSTPPNPLGVSPSERSSQELLLYEALIEEKGKKLVLSEVARHRKMLEYLGSVKVTRID